MASSIDGFIASLDGGVDWIDTNVELDEDLSFETFLGRVDTILMGRKSYEQALTFGEWPYKDHRVIVLSRSGFKPQTPHTEIITNLNADWFENLKSEKGKDIWLFGGGSLNGALLEHDLIDEIMLFVQPILLGSGIHLFGNRPHLPVKFLKMDTRDLGSGFTLLHYQKCISN